MSTIRTMAAGLPHKFVIKIQTSAEGVEPITFDDLENNYVDIVCVFSGNAKRKVIAKWSKIEREGYVQLKKLNSYEYQGVIETAVTAQLNPGTYYMGVNLAVTDADIADGTYNEAEEIAIIKIVPTKTDIGLESEIEEE